MRNVMIVDDESLVRIGLQSMIDWESRGYRIAGVFRNGEEALAAADRGPFDIVLTDIRMPGMDGFELIRELKLRFPELQIIVLSSYNDFEYARQAMRLGVADYISKYEMEPEELLRVLASLPKTQPRTDGGQRVSGELADLAGAGLREEAEGLLQDTEPGKDRGAAEPPVPALKGWLRETEAAFFRWIALLPRPRAEGYSSAERRAMLHLAEELLGRPRGALLLGESGGLLHGIYASGPLPGEGAAGREECLRLAAEWEEAFAQKLNVAMAVGFGGPSAPDAGWTEARREAEAAAEASLFGGSARFREEMGEWAAFTEEEWLELYKGIKRRIRFMQFRPLAAELIALLDEDAERRRPQEWIRLGVAAAAQLADFVIERYDPAPGELRDRFGSLWPFAEAAGAVRTADEWRRTLLDIAARTGEIVSYRQAKAGWLERVKAYLDVHFAEPVRLDDMAQLANFSEGHFSQRFREETGQPFSDYLTDLRIREAVRLFRDTELSTEEIAERVGYSNPNYFVKVFKRRTGQTVKLFKSAK